MTSKSITNTASRKKITNLTITGLFSALICVTTAYIFHIPFGMNGGYIHVGDALIYLAAALLPTPYAMAAGALGGVLADLLTAPMWAPATLLIKMMLAIPFTCRKEKIVTKQNVIAIFIAGTISTIGYYLAEVILLGSEAAFIASVTSSVIQAIGSGILFVVVGLALDKMHLKAMFKNKL